MAKGQKHSNREAKKPKAAQPKPTSTQPAAHRVGSTPAPTMPERKAPRPAKSK